MPGLSYLADTNILLRLIKSQDAHLVAAMHVHGVSHLLTLNDRDFTRYPGITIVHPRSILEQGL